MRCYLPDCAPLDIARPRESSYKNLVLSPNNVKDGTSVRGEVHRSSTRPRHDVQRSDEPRNSPCSAHLQVGVLAMLFAIDADLEIGATTNQPKFSRFSDGLFCVING